MRVYLTNVATVAASNRGSEASHPKVGPGPVLGIMREPSDWALPMLAGHVRALMPRRRELFRAKAGVLTFDAYRALLEERWAQSDLRPGRLHIAQRGVPPNGGRVWKWDGQTWWPSLPVPDGATLVCTCAIGEPCHRQVAADMLAAAGWTAVLDGVEISRVDAPEVAR